MGINRLSTRPRLDLELSRLARRASACVLKIQKTERSNAAQKKIAP
jgi:hypothetical protein